MLVLLCRREHLQPLEKPPSEPWALNTPKCVWGLAELYLSVLTLFLGYFNTQNTFTTCSYGLGWRV